MKGQAARWTFHASTVGIAKTTSATTSATAVAARGSRARASRTFHTACTSAAPRARRSADVGMCGHYDARPMPSAIVFDFNGTLSDDEPVMCEIFRTLFAEHGRPLTERQYYEELAGLSDPEIVRTW